MKFNEYTLEEKSLVFTAWATVLAMCVAGIVMLSIIFKGGSTKTPEQISKEMGGLIAPGVPRTDYGQKGSNDGRQR
jgi:hypothetical protein